MGRVHVIRLRGPWVYEPIARFESTALGRFFTQPITHGLPPEGKTRLPEDWSATLGRGFHGMVRYKRIFHKPTGLEAESSVWLVVERVRSGAEIRLNDYLLGELHTEDHALRVTITPMLQDTNNLEIVVAHPELQRGGWPVSGAQVDEAGGVVGEVRLEIRGG